MMMMMMMMMMVMVMVMLVVCGLNHEQQYDRTKELVFRSFQSPNVPFFFAQLLSSSRPPVSASSWDRESRVAMMAPGAIKLEPWCEGKATN